MGDLSTGKYWSKTWNVFRGCSHHGPACDHCWARALAARFPAVHGDFTPTFLRDRLDEPLKWRKPQVVFCNNTGDWMHEAFSLTQIRQQLLTMEEAPEHQYLTLTKRYARLLDVIGDSEDLDRGVLPWWGMTAWDRESTESALRQMECVRGRTWLSLEPLLADPQLLKLPKVALESAQWVVVGAESGTGRRRCDVDWIRGVVSDCSALSIPIWVKQLDLDGRCSHDPSEWPDDLRVRELPQELSHILTGQSRPR